MDAIDWMTPFKNKPDHHEDRLTWGLLVTLQYVPELQRYLRDLLGEHENFQRSSTDYWEPAEILTQKKSLGEQFTRLVSVLLTDAPMPESIPVTLVERDAVYDGIIEFSDGLLVIIENKLKAGNVWKEQLNPAKSSIPPTHTDYKIHGNAVVLEWASLLEAFLRFESSGTASYAARLLISDFLHFVERAHPTLTPYRTFELCKNQEPALGRRISRLVEELAESSPALSWHQKPGLATPHIKIPDGVARRWRLAVARDQDNRLVLREHIWPGDTVAQARQFFDNVDLGRMFALGGWIVSPNLHFSFRSSHLVWARTSLNVKDYVEIFASDKAAFGQTSADEHLLMPRLEEWVEKGLIARSDVADVSRHFIETKRKTVNIIPGLGLQRDWPLDAIVDMEQKGSLESTLLASVNEALATWGQSI